MSELRRRPRQARPNAFDPARTDSDDVVSPVAEPPLAGLLARVQPAAVPAIPRPARPASVSEARTPAPAPNPQAERPRGSGGPAGTATKTKRITATAARVPIEVYDAAEDLVKGRGRPSWGQLVAWTCETREEDVVTEVISSLRPTPGVLVPRGQNKRGSAATQVTARFTPDEHAAFERARAAAESAAFAAGLDTPVTATAVVVAALSVAASVDAARH